MTRILGFHSNNEQFSLFLVSFEFILNDISFNKEETPNPINWWP